MAAPDLRLSDLTPAPGEPIEVALEILSRAAAHDIEYIYPVSWLLRVIAFGGSAHVSWVPVDKGRPPREGETVDAGCVERLFVGQNLDHERRQSPIDALCQHLRSTEGARAAVIASLNRQGRFSDGRPYASPFDAVDQVHAAGVSLMINRQGDLEPGDCFDEYADPHAHNWPKKRALERLDASLRQSGWEAEIIEIIRDRGALHEGSGWVVLEGAKA